MNRSIVFKILGHILKLEGLFLLLPTLVAIIYKENKGVVAYFGVAVAVYLIGFLLTKTLKPKTDLIYAKEGFLTVSLAWIFMSATGAIPFVLTADMPSYVDALFEMVSGFTTTGASVVADVTALSKATLFWRSFSHWIGGMGVLVFMMAIISNITDRSIHIIRAEMPGPVVGKLVPKVRDTAKILYIIYAVLTFVEVVFLLFGGMPLFDSLLHAFGTAGTGGFGLAGDSIASFSPYIQWVIAIFMMIFGINFNLYYLILIKRISSVFKSTEPWAYLGIIAVSTGLITVNTISNLPVGDTIRHAFFQVTSIITTTGYSSVDFNLWPQFSKSILLLIMFIGGCAGSTAGGLKMSRFLILCRMIKREIKRLIHPRSVSDVKLEGKRVDETTISSTGTYFAIYIMCILTTFLLLSFDKFDFTDTLTVSISCFNNVGPAFGAFGPMSSYAEFSQFSKVVLSFAMLFGRLEIFPMIIALTPSTWVKK